MTMHDRIPDNSSRITRDPFPGSRKVWVEGSDPSVRVPMREIEQSPTLHAGPDGETKPEANPPMSDSLRDRLASYFSDDIVELEGLLDRDLSVWRSTGV